MATVSFLPISAKLCHVLRFGSKHASVSTQKRWFDWDPNVTKRDGKPAITGSKHLYVSAKIPVVLLRDVQGLGVKGSIVEVKRGYARNCLVPNGDAVYGTVWENIDAYADPTLAVKRDAEKGALSDKASVPFEWLNSVRLEFVRETVVSSNLLIEPLRLSEVLVALSQQEQIDLLPSQVSFPKEGILTVGKFTIDITLELKVGTYKYTSRVDVKDKLELAAAERREADLREAMKISRPEFVLGNSRIGVGKHTDIGTEDDEDSDSEK